MTTKPLFTTPATMARAKTPPTPRTRKTPRNTWAETTTTGTCPTCNQPTINTLENSAVRIHNTADPTTLTSPQELDTLKTGRHTYQLNTRTNTMERRTIHHIRSNPPEHDKYPTLPQHACGQIMGTPITPNQQKEKTVNENPPF